MTAPSPFSTTIPNLQLVWDSTSLKALQTCPRSYQLGILEGWREQNQSVHLDFGIYFASAIETYKKARAEGKSKHDATLDALQRVVTDSWITDEDGCNGCEGSEGYPWGGNYESQWHCKGETKYRNAKGNAAKCPYSHKGHWVPGTGPSVCGTCGSDTETVRRYAPNDNAKNRHTLVRLVAWYCEEQPEEAAQGLQVLKFPNGKVAAELSFKIPLPWKAKSGEPYVLAGHLDSIMTDGIETFIADNKTTKNAMGQSYWKQFSPNTQISTYDLAGSLLFPELKLGGVMIEAAQVMVEGARFGQHIVHINNAQREEYFQEIKYYLDKAEEFAESGYWPMNRVNCKLCPFNTICSKEPAKREGFLKADFVKRPWNPLEER